MKKVGGYLLFIVLSNAIYGVALYFVYTWLAGFSLLYAALGNLSLILLALAWDEGTQRMLESDEIVSMIKKEKDVEKNYRFVRSLTNSFVSYKTALYLFYIVILVFAQVLEFHPTLVGDAFKSFILANNFSILFLIAFDMLIRQFRKDRERMEKASAHLAESLSGEQG
jgi:predicted metal-dependent hydrolase